MRNAIYKLSSTHAQNGGCRLPSPVSSLAEHLARKIAMYNERRTRKAGNYNRKTELILVFGKWLKTRFGSLAVSPWCVSIAPKRCGYSRFIYLKQKYTLKKCLWDKNEKVIWNFSMQIKDVAGKKFTSSMPCVHSSTRNQRQKNPGKQNLGTLAFSGRNSPNKSVWIHSKFGFFLFVAINF